MTNEEIDKIVARIERKTLWRSILTTQINTFAFVAFGCLASFAAVMGEFIGAFMLLLLPIFPAILSLGIAIQRYHNSKRVKFWNYVRERGLLGGEPTDDTKLLIDKIVEIQTATPGNELLTLRQSVKLIAAYERQSQRLETINVRLTNLNSTHQTLSKKMKQLQALGENHSAGLQGLSQTRTDFVALQKVAHEIQSSCDRLEAIINGVRKTAKARQLHRELDQLSTPITPRDEPTFDAESLEEIERQIGREIETYLRLERETDEHLR